MPGSFNLETWECGDGNVRSNAAAAFPSPIVAKTDDYTIKGHESGKCFSNAGASGAVVFTLPTPWVGAQFHFVKVVQDQDLTIDVPSGVKIDDQTAGYSLSNTVTEVGLATITVEGVSATEYAVRFRNGTWLRQGETGVTLTALEEGSDGQLIVGQTGSAPVYRAVTGDVTITAAGATAIGSGKVVASNLSTTLKTGFIPLDITALRIIAGDVIGNTTEGMLLDGNTAPSLQRVNSATDKALRVIWASSSSVECQFPPVPKPPDLNGAADASVHLLLAKDTNTDNAVTVDVQVFDGVGDTECGAATAAIAAATLAEYSATIALADLGDHPGFLNISLIPGTHTTDAIYLYAAWIEYVRA